MISHRFEIKERGHVHFGWFFPGFGYARCLRQGTETVPGEPPGRRGLFVSPEAQRALSLIHISVAAPVFWNLLEPEEGVYDYSQVHMLLQQAEAHGMHLILLWFGSWKNGASQYLSLIHI